MQKFNIKKGNIFIEGEVVCAETGLPVQDAIVTDIKIIEKDNDDAAKGAYAIADGMKDWNPGKQRGKGVPVKFLLPVEFK